jgi:uncharacterized protein YjbI with pentapeptide repeats
MNIIQVLEKINAHRRWMAGDPTGIAASFAGENLSGMNLSGQHLGGVDFTGATLTGTNLAQSLAPGADFTGADLTNANLSGGIFFGATFNDAILTGANMNGSSFDEAYFIDTVFGSNDMRDATFTVSKMSFPIYTFTVAGLPAVASPSDLRIGEVSHPWSTWTNTYLNTFFIEDGEAPKELHRFTEHVNFFRQLLIERGYSL